ncbi:replication-relaxation family protein [Paenibacillus alginolyticus]|uniref:hypothetical protein n=1 Tax=Paenibacillus alginolyticus TaxID=59839 RepID=UPI00049250F6|nr:hypothetical protein [Paenibacillus alginolyticus]MCY9665843.1 replication-relaxation family protein [Paenibacillus alginolyticus]
MDESILMAQGNFTSFEEMSPKGGTGERETSFPRSSPMVPEHLNPYTDSVCRSDIYELLLPDGTRFGMFSDPYATIEYHDPKFGLQNGRYWLDAQVNGADVSKNDLKLVDVLSTNRTMTRKQLERVIFPGLQPGERSGVDFIKRCRSRGIICAYRWSTPLKDERKKPLAYILTKVGADAAEILFHRKLNEEQWARPVEYSPGQGPDMTPYFVDLVANELYTDLVRIDRLISWQRRPVIRVDQNVFHIPVASFEVIRDRNDFLQFWVEVFRPSKDFIRKTAERFARLRQVYLKLPDHKRPARIMLIADGDSRIPLLSRIAEQYMPEVPLRFTTDERLLAGMSRDTFLEYNNSEKKMTASTIKFLLEDAPGMRASEYFSESRVNDHDDFED